MGEDFELFSSFSIQVSLELLVNGRDFLCGFEKQFLFRHGLMLPWFKDLINITEKLQFIDPTFRHSFLVPSSGVI